MFIFFTFHFSFNKTRRKHDLPGASSPTPTVLRCRLLGHAEAAAVAAPGWQAPAARHQGLPQFQKNHGCASPERTLFQKKNYVFIFVKQKLGQNLFLAVFWLGQAKRKALILRPPLNPNCGAIWPSCSTWRLLSFRSACAGGARRREPIRRWENAQLMTMLRWSLCFLFLTLFWTCF